MNLPSWSDGTPIMQIPDPIHGQIILPRLEASLVNTPPFQRLRRVCQLPAKLIFPSANHTRFDHSLGVYYSALMAIAHLEVRGELTGISRRALKEFELACLLHDVGHGPYSHALEGLLPSQSHEEAGRRFVENSEIADLLEGSAWRINPGRVADYIDPPGGEKSPPLLGLLSGPVDADKMDYLPRDYGSIVGIGIGKIKEFIRKVLKALRFSARGELALSLEGVAGVKEMYRLRQDLFSKYYWDPRVRALERMLSRAVQDALLGSCISVKRIGEVGDEELLTLLLLEGEKPPSVRPLLEAFILREWYKPLLSLEPRAEFYLDSLRNRCVEVKVCQELGFQDHDILFVPPKRMGWDKPIRVLLPGGALIPWEEAAGEDLSKFRRPEREQRAYVICAPDRYCDLRGKRQEIYDALMRAIS